MAHVRIFISAVSREFAGYRDLLRGYLQRPNVTVHIQEDFIAGGLPTLDKLDRYIKECDAVIHLVGDMTGAMAQPASLEHIIDCYPEFPNKLPDLTPAFKGALDVSYTQWEAYLAIYHKKELLVAVPMPGAPREASTYVKSGEQEAAQQAHLKRLERYERFPVRFKDGENLALQLFKSTLYDLLISAGVQPFRQALDDINTEAERRHRELVESQHAIAAQIAREKGVDPKDLIAILENLGLQEPNISTADIPQRLRERIDAMRAAAAQRPAPSNEGRDIEQVREDSRALLKDAKSEEALKVLNRQIEVEKAALEDRKRRTVTLLADRAEVERLRYDYAATKGTLDEVLRLDPDLFWRWIDLGNLWMTTGPLADALPAFRSAQAAAGRSGNAREQGIALIWVGDVQVAQGDLAGALNSYRDSLAIADRLAQSDPGKAEWQHDLSVSYDRVGNVQVAQGDLAGALKSYRDSLAIRDRLAQSDPGNAGWQRNLSVSYEKVGDVQVAQGDLAGARKTYRDSLAIRDRLAQSDPGKAEWQHDLSVSYDRVGNVQVAQGDLAGALKSYRDSLAIRDRLAQSDPGNAGWQRDLSVSYEKVGDVQVAQGDLAGALKSYRDSLAIRDRLTQSDPSNAGWQRDVAVSHAKLATAFKKSGETPQALDALRQGRDIMARLTALSPTNAEWKGDLTWFEGQLAG